MILCIATRQGHGANLSRLTGPDLLRHVQLSPYVLLEIKMKAEHVTSLPNTKGREKRRRIG